VCEIIDFLERMGTDAQLRGASADELEAALVRAGLTSTLWTSISTMDRGGLESLLGARANVCCLVYSPDKEEEEKEDEAEEEEGEDEDDKEDNVKKSQDRVRRSA
jgi:hypothetical protein